VVGQLGVRSAPSLRSRDVGEQEAGAGRLDGRGKVAGGRGQRVVGGAVQFLAGGDEVCGGAERFSLALSAAGHHASRCSKRAAVEHGAGVPGPSADDEGCFGQGGGRKFDIQPDWNYNISECIADEQCLPKAAGVHLILADLWSREWGQPQ